MSTKTRGPISITDQLQKRIEAISWQAVKDQLHENGYAIVDKVLNAEHCENLRGLYDERDGYRKTVVMERFRFGKGEYKYFGYPLPQVVEYLRKQVYARLVPVANQWMEQLQIDKRFPITQEELVAQCHAKGQLKPTPLLLKYGAGGFNTLHQDLYGEVYFPFQAVILLSDPETDFSGGEFVLTQQNPRAQSRAIVLTPGRGDMIIFTTNFRPVSGRRGYYRVGVKHGVSEVKKGRRFTLGIIFHDALS